MNLTALDNLGLTWHQKVAYLGTRMLEAEQASTTLEHSFEPGVYVRTMVLPAGTVFIGRPHRFGHALRFEGGTARVITPDGDSTIKAPFEVHTAPGHITVLEAITGLVLRTFHPNPDECRDTDLMEGLIFHSAEEMKLVGDAVAQQIRSLT